MFFLENRSQSKNMAGKAALFTTPCENNQMLHNKKVVDRQGEITLLSALTREVDSIFFNLRKADQIIRRELNLLKQNKQASWKKAPIKLIDEETFRAVFEKITLPGLLVDEYIAYMLKNDDNSIFELIEKYNKCLNKRQIQQADDQVSLKRIDEKLAYYIRHLGAMTYHLNIHLNLLGVLLKNASGIADCQDSAIQASKEIVMEHMVKEWGEQQQNVNFLEITIDGTYALVTWALDELNGDAILLQEDGYWQLINISAGRFEIKDFENADVPLEIAERMLKLHHQKLGY